MDLQGEAQRGYHDTNNGTVPAFPGLRGENLDISWRPVESGPRENHDCSSTARLQASLEGTIAGWDYNTAISHSVARANSTFCGGYLVDGRIIDGVGAGILNPFGPQSPAGADYLANSLLLGEYVHARINSRRQYGWWLGCGDKQDRVKEPSCS